MHGASWNAMRAMSTDGSCVPVQVFQAYQGCLSISTVWREEGVQAETDIHDPETDVDGGC